MENHITMNLLETRKAYEHFHESKEMPKDMTYQKALEILVKQEGIPILETWREKFRLENPPPLFRPMAI